MEGSRQVFEFEKLNSENYNSWRQDMKVMLMERNCWAIVSGTEKAPDELSHEKVIRDYNAREAKSYSSIYLGVSKEYRPIISSTQDGKTAWEILESHFRPDSRARIVSLTDEFFECKPGDGEPVGLFGARIRKICDELIDAGKPMDDWFQAFQLIRHLPKEFSGITQSIYRWTDAEFKYDKVLQELVAEESRLKLCHKDSERHITEGFALQNSGKNKIKGKKQVKCFNCGKMGHFASNCRSKDKKRQADKREDPELNYVMEEALLNENVDDKAWVFDTAASSHFCGNRELFWDFKELHNSSMAIAINGISCPITGTGTIKIKFPDQEGNEIICLNNVLYSENLRRNLMAGPRIDDGGGSFVGKKGKIDVFHSSGRKMCTARRKGNLYYIYPQYIKAEKPQKVKKEIHNVEASNLEELHRKFSHINCKYIINTCKNEATKGMPKITKETVDCEVCKIAKGRRVSFKNSGKIKSKKPLQLVHMDLCGPMPKASREGFKYFLTITDDFSRKATVFPIRRKSDVIDRFLQYQRRVERFLNSKILSVRTDNGLEFCSSEFENFLGKQGIRAERTNPYTPEQNGVSERYNYTAMDGVKALLKESGLPPSFWAEALLCYTYCWNRVCHGEGKKTPFELFSGHKPSVKHLQIFGSVAYVGTPKPLRNKLEMRAKKGIFVGYAMKTKGYRVWLPEESKIVETINVRFEKYVRDKNRSGAVLDPYKEEKSKNKREVVRYDIPDLTGYDSESSSDNECEETSPEKKGKIPEKIVWVREAVPRKDGSRTDIYFKVKGTKGRLRSRNEVENYCKAHDLNFDESKFCFSGKNNFRGEILSIEDQDPDQEA